MFSTISAQLVSLAHGTWQSALTLIAFGLLGQLGQVDRVFVTHCEIGGSGEPKLAGGAESQRAADDECGPVECDGCQHGLSVWGKWESADEAGNRPVMTRRIAPIETCGERPFADCVRAQSIAPRANEGAKGGRLAGTAPETRAEVALPTPRPPRQDRARRAGVMGAASRWHRLAGEEGGERANWSPSRSTRGEMTKEGSGGGYLRGKVW